jgi:hypothetical protein
MQLRQDKHRVGKLLPALGGSRSKRNKKGKH